MKLDEHTKLARIIIDLDSSSDLLWQVDVSKSRASIPTGNIKNNIDAICRKTRKEAEEVYRHRGKVVSRNVGAPDKFIWKTIVRPTGETSFKINRKHPFIERIYEKYEGPSKDLNLLFSLIESLLPTENIQLTGNSGKLDLPEIDLNEILHLAEKMAFNQITIGKSAKVAVRDLLTTEPFDKFQQEIREYLNIHE